MWLLLALLTAFFVSLQDIFGKEAMKKVDVYVAAWSWMFFSLPFLCGSLFFQNIPPIKPPFWGALCVSTVILIFASILYFKAIRASDLSLSIPMMAFTPLFLLITSPVILGEFPGPLGVLGIGFIVCGAYTLHFKEKSKGYLEPFKCLIREKGPRYMLLVALLYSVGANIDKIGVRNSSPLMWITLLNFVLAGALGLIMLRKSTNIVQQIKSAWPLFVAIGFCNAVGLISQMTAIQMTLVPYLIAVKRTSVFMTALFGFFIFKEKGMRERLIGVVLMVLGVFIISFSQ